MSKDFVQEKNHVCPNCFGDSWVELKHWKGPNTESDGERKSGNYYSRGYSQCFWCRKVERTNKPSKETESGTKQKLKRKKAKVKTV